MFFEELADVVMAESMQCVIHTVAANCRGVLLYQMSHNQLTMQCWCWKPMLHFV